MHGVRKFKRKNIGKLFFAFSLFFGRLEGIK